MATTPAAPPPGARGRMTFSVQRLPQPLLLDQAVLDPTWNTFKTVMVFLGGMAIMGWIVWFSFQLGANNIAPTPRRIVSRASVKYAPVKPPAPSAINIHVDGEVRVAPATSVPMPLPVEPTVEELNRRYVEYLRRRDR